MKPTVSVVVACRDMAPYLGEAIRSVVAQTFADWELWIVDDGSSDNPSAIVDAFANEKRIRFVRIERRGQSFAKSLGVRLAAGEWIAFLDADDVWKPGKLEVQLRNARHHPDVSIWFTDRYLLNGEPFHLNRAHAEISRESLFERNPICFSSSLVHRGVFERIGLFHPTIDRSIDYDFWLRAAADYRFGYVDEKLVGYRTGHASLSVDKVARMEAVARITEENLRYRKPVAKVVKQRARSSTFRNLGYYRKGEHPIRSLSAYWRAFREDKNPYRWFRSSLNVFRVILVRGANRSWRYPRWSAGKFPLRRL